MTITEDQGEKQATCPGCGQVVVIPDAASGVRTRRQSKSNSERARESTPPPERTLGTPRDQGKRAPHEQQTRAEEFEEAPAALTAFLAPPQQSGEIGRLGGYRVLGVVGSGGMGVVFRAEDPLLQRLVALKAMLPHLASTDTARQRFLREARAAAGILHDHIVPIYQVGEDRGVPFLAMPFLEGETLDRRLARLGGPLPTSELLRIAREIALGLETIHRRGLVHRDIKPANVWLETLLGEPGALAPGGTRVKILDFGLARAAQGESHLTLEGAVVGSPAFMAPEQALRQPVDARADLFGLGCVMYLMATGKLAFEAEDALATMLAVTRSEPTPPGELNPDLPAEVEELVLALLAKSPDDRPATARSVVERLKRIEDCLSE
jgi:serine/threonine protein kinase